jgi:hypothetical protein
MPCPSTEGEENIRVKVSKDKVKEDADRRNGDVRREMA